MHQSASAVHFSILPEGFGPNVVLNAKGKAAHVAPHPISQIPVLCNDTKTKALSKYAREVPTAKLMLYKGSVKC